MRGRGRTLILIGLIVLVGAVAVGALLLRGGGGGEPSPEGTPEVYVPETTRDIVVAAQNIPQSTLITADNGAVTLETWSEDALPDYILTEVFTDVADVYGLRARVDVARGMIIVKSMLTEEPSGLGTGSETAWQIPSGKVAYALPVARYSSVAWALQPGDHVDVLISLLMVDLDEEFQSILPNQAQCVSPSEDPACAALSGQVGRLEGLPNNWVVNLTPGETPRPRLVTQLAVQDAIVLRVGDWQEKREEPPVEEEPTEEEAAEQPVEPSRAEVEPLTLVVAPQDAIALKHALELGADIDLVLRSAGDTTPVTTESVTLQYLLDRFNIEQPPKLPYGVEPRLKSLPGTTSGVAGGDASGGRTPPSD